MTAQQEQATEAPLQALQGQEAAISKQLAAAEARLRSYDKEFAQMSGTERDLNLLVRQNRESQVINLRGQLDAVRQKIANVKAGVSSGNEDLIARVREGPAIVTDVPAGLATTEPPLTIFGLAPHQLRGPAEFLLLFPLVLALSRWIWRRSPARPARETPLEGNAQINRLEQAVEAIAIEVERISEAQRFSAKLMAERPKEPVIERLRESVSPPRRVVTPLP